MKFKPLPLDDAFLITPNNIIDERGFFARLYCNAEFGKVINNFKICQVNNALSLSKGTLRGIHLQLAPKYEEKLVRCINGAIWDLIIDLRLDSKTFGKWYGEEISSENRKMMFIPKGFGHGYITLTDNAEIIYFVSEKYDADYEIGIRWDDPTFGIKWPIDPSVISKKDSNFPNFNSDSFII